MPAILIEAPLGIRCVFSDGRRAEYHLDDLPSPRLARDLAAGLAELIHPHGTADSGGTVVLYVRALRSMVRALAAAGFTGGAADLRRGQLAEFWMAGPMRLEALTRSMVEGFARSGGGLGEGVLELAAGRHFNVQAFRRALPPYPEADWQRLTGICRKVTDGSYAAHRQVLIDASGAQHPGPGRWQPANLHGLLARLGPVSISEFATHLGISDAVVRSRGGFHDAVMGAFPHLDTLIAYRLLFGIYSGIVPDGIADLITGDIDWAGDSTILLSYVKGRTAQESLNLPRPAVRLLEQWLAHSALLRTFVPPPQRDMLWLGMSQAGKSRLVRRVDPVAIQRWAVRHGVLGEDGQPLKIHRARIRTTHQAMRDKGAWSGSARAMIDPNHTRPSEATTT